MTDHLDEPNREYGPGDGAPVPGPPRPGPNMMPRTTGPQASVNSGPPMPDPTTPHQDSTIGESDPGTVTDAVVELLRQVDEVRQSTGDTFDLDALARQTELLERAHEVLTSALEDVDPR